MAGIYDVHPGGGGTGAGLAEGLAAFLGPFGEAQRMRRMQLAEKQKQDEAFAQQQALEKMHEESAVNLLQKKLEYEEKFRKRPVDLIRERIEAAQSAEFKQLREQYPQYDWGAMLGAPLLEKYEGKGRGKTAKTPEQLEMDEIAKATRAARGFEMTSMVPSERSAQRLRNLHAAAQMPLSPGAQKRLRHITDLYADTIQKFQLSTTQGGKTKDEARDILEKHLRGLQEDQVADLFIDAVGGKPLVPTE